MALKMLSLGHVEAGSPMRTSDIATKVESTLMTLMSLHVIGGFFGGEKIPQQSRDSWVYP